MKELRDTFYIEDEHGYKIFEIQVMQYPNGQYSDVSCEFIVKYITSWDAETNEPIEEDKEDYLNMTVKWDGCSHLYFGDSIDEEGAYSSYHHFCGARSFKQHVRLLHTLYNKAYEYMGRKPYDKSEEWNEL